MKIRCAVVRMMTLLALAPVSASLLAQQVPVQQVRPTPGISAPSASGVANALQAVANSTNTTAQPPAQLPTAIPQLPQIKPAAGNSGVRGAANIPTPRTARVGGQPSAPQTAKTVAASAPVTPSASMDTMLTKLAPQMDLRVGSKDAGGLRLSGTVGIVVMMGLLTLLPTLVLLMTGFTRILIVLNFLRQALGTQNAPPAQMVAALSLILTGFVMAPTLNKVNETALQPWMNGKMEQAEMMKTAVIPFREFMLKHTRDHDLQVFIDMSSGVAPRNEDEIPLVTLVSAFATSELRTAFQIGFALFLPFIIIDIVVSSVLMSMGMFMLPPAMISLPFKLLLFVLVDGWTLVVQSLVTSFRV
ncbi:MAG: flagellar type III secretion system pore protein FliP [Gemmatimonadaceae bacterium]